MRRDCHDCTCAVISQDVVGNPNRDRLLCHRVDCRGTGKYTRFLFFPLCTISIAFERGCFAVLVDHIGLLSRSNFRDQRMLWSQNQIGRSVERIGAGRVNPYRVPSSLFAILSCYRKIDLCPSALANPIGLQLLDANGPVEQIQIRKQSISIGGDSQHPLPKWNSLYGMVSSLASAIDDLLVGQHCP